MEITGIYHTYPEADKAAQSMRDFWNETYAVSKDDGGRFIVSRGWPPLEVGSSTGPHKIIEKIAEYTANGLCGHCGRVLDGSIQRCSNDGFCVKVGAA
jgi:hypothetical protein